MRLAALKLILDKKLHRRNITVIQDDLPPKTEFVIYTSLSEIQRRLYEALINTGCWKEQASLFKWINILRLICNHPYTLEVCKL